MHYRRALTKKVPTPSKTHTPRATAVSAAAKAACPTKSRNKSQPKTLTDFYAADAATFSSVGMPNNPCRYRNSDSSFIFVSSMMSTSLP